MNWKYSYISSFLAVLCLDPVYSRWRGHTTTRKYSYWLSSYSCYIGVWPGWYNNWSSCWAFRREYYIVYGYKESCSIGWTHNGNENCNIPICSPRCRNGGTCVQPNKCSCTSAYTGDICAGVSACSYRKPCYPGRCSGVTCDCSYGFGGRSCLTLQSDDFLPTIEKINSTFTYHSDTLNKDEYSYKSDATNMKTPDITWTNQGKFNKLEFHLKAHLDDTYVFSRNPSRPSYIRTVKFGIVSATATVIHMKLKNGGLYEANRENLECPNLSSTTPKTDLSCDLTTRYIIQFDSGDKYKVHFSVSTGGYRQLVKNGYNYGGQQTYNVKKTENSMELHFDYDDPVHCIEDFSCYSGEVPFIIPQDVTKGALNAQASGWKDNLSGISRYVFEVWKMEYSYDFKGLREPLINTTFNPVPLLIQEVNASNTISFPTYEPNEPGVYSAILEVNDKANNSKYARQIAIYDKTSNISTSSDHEINVTTASELSNFTWQTSQFSKIDVTWSGHFVNKVHEKGFFLEKILDYDPRLDDGSEGRRHDYKKILPDFDDHTGKRNKAAIPNMKSIIRFETIGILGVPTSVVPKTGWEDVVPLSDIKSFPLTDIRDGNSYQIWIRAHDIMGNSKVDSTAVHFDRSEPSVPIVKSLEYNIDDGAYPFSSRVRVSARDNHSGVRKVSFRFIVNGTLIEKAKKDFFIETQSKETCERIPSDCYCVKMGDCFLINTVLDINNCWLKVPIHQVANFVLLLEVTVYNSAMLSSKNYTTIGTVKHLQGIQQYYSPSNITVVSTSSSSVSIKWIQAKTCYERAGIVIVLYKPDNTTKEYPVDKDATTFDLSGLSSLTSYWFLMYTKYGNDTNVVTSASPAKFAFATQEKVTGFPTSGIAGISAGFIVLLIVVIIVLVLLGRTGRLQPAKQCVTAGIRTVRNTIRVRPTTNSFNNRAIASKEDDDIYFYGGMEMKENNMKISRKDISLESELARGRFAVIFLAKYYNKSECHEVVAKTLKDDQSEDAIMKMKAKINFYTKKVGRQKNVLEFIGSVEDEVRGPIMILEYCSKGVLKQFLEAIRSNISNDIEEKLFRMVFGICQGMNFLASKQVVHRRLAARNILLNSILEPKITGFGPDPSYDEGEDNPGNERIPIKWVAPECMKSTQHANELSDVWSFGIVMWEIFSLGETPYPGLQSREVPGKIKKGYKMAKPELCDDAFYEVMLKCWHYDPRKRSGFEQLKEQMNTMFTEAPGDDYYYRTNDL